MTTILHKTFLREEFIIVFNIPEIFLSEVL